MLVPGAAAKNVPLNFFKYLFRKSANRQPKVGGFQKFVVPGYAGKSNDAVKLFSSGQNSHWDQEHRKNTQEENCRSFFILHKKGERSDETGQNDKYANQIHGNVPFFLLFSAIVQGLYSSNFKTAKKASVGTWTVPRLRIFFLPSFCFSKSFFFLVISPP